MWSQFVCLLLSVYWKCANGTEEKRTLERGMKSHHRFLRKRLILTRFPPEYLAASFSPKSFIPTDTTSSDSQDTSGSWFNDPFIVFMAHVSCEFFFFGNVTCLCTWLKIHDTCAVCQRWSAWSLSEYLGGNSTFKGFPSNNCRWKMERITSNLALHSHFNSDIRLIHLDNLQHNVFLGDSVSNKLPLLIKRQEVREAALKNNRRRPRTRSYCKT